LVINSILTGTYMTMVRGIILCIKKTEEVWSFEQNLKQVFVSYMKQSQM